jgi:hypothetical protein
MYRISVILPRLLLVGCAIFLLAACSSQTSSTSSTPTVQPTHIIPTQTQPTPTSPPVQMLYQADWSHGLAGWRGASGWSITQGQLQVNSPSETSITVPYRSAPSNYAIELQVQLIRVLKNQANQFFVEARAQPNEDGYQAGFMTLTAPPATENPGGNFYAGFAQVIVNHLGPNNQNIQEIDFVPSYRLRTYRIEVQGNQVSLFVDSVLISTSTTSEPAISKGPLVLDAQGLLLRIKSFRIMTLEQ